MCQLVTAHSSRLCLVNRPVPHPTPIQHVVAGKSQLQPCDPTNPLVSGCLGRHKEERGSSSDGLTKELQIQQHEHRPKGSRASKGGDMKGRAREWDRCRQSFKLIGVCHLVGTEEVQKRGMTDSSGRNPTRHQTEFAYAVPCSSSKLHLDSI